MTTITKPQQKRTKGASMRNTLELENIEEMRQSEGIDDVELRKEIRMLHVGDFVKLTFLTHASSFETLLVRITNIQGSAFRGKLASRPASIGLSNLRVESSITFAATHIHSVPKGMSAYKQ